jgi:hypothetical protein
VGGVTDEVAVSLQAVHRFEMYLSCIVKSPAREADAELPPLDVALVWHSYLLNPRCVLLPHVLRCSSGGRDGVLGRRSAPRTDLVPPLRLDGTARILCACIPSLTRSTTCSSTDSYVFFASSALPFRRSLIFPSRALRQADSLNPNTLQLIHNRHQINAWQALTETPFDPLEALASAQGRYVRCPLSGQVVFTRKLLPLLPSETPRAFTDPLPIPPAWVTPDGKGYAQQSFSIPSPINPTFLITHEVLGISKLARDIQILGSTSPPVHHLSGTLFAANEDKDGAENAELRGKRLKKLLITWKSPFFSSDGVQLGEAMQWSLEGARKAMVKQYKGRSGPG